MERRLVAILAADVVGFSRLVREDEEGTLQTLSTCRDAFEGLIAKHKGRIFGSAGDSFIAEFASPVAAVRCAVEIQDDLERRNTELPEDRRMRFRIGINLGDVAVEGDNLLGDGVNVAARLETLAEAGGICLSQPVFDQITNKLDLGYEYLGEQEVKNISEPIRVYRVVTDPEAAGKLIGETKRTAKTWKPATIAASLVTLIGLALLFTWLKPWEPKVEIASVERMAYPLPDKPSVAVLPFTNMSGDPEQEYFADGMTDDLITDLSKVTGLFVIARNTSFIFKGKTVAISEVAEKLGVRYVLEGSVRRSGDQMRINAQLIDATTGGHLWAERYDGGISDIFAVQDEFVRKITNALALNLSNEEKVEIVKGRTANIDAKEAFQQGWEHYQRYTPKDNAKAAEYLKQAIKLDPEYGRAHAALGLVYVRGCQYRWHRDLEMSSGDAFSKARAQLFRGAKNSSSLTKVAASQIELYDNEHDKAITEAARAVALDPNDPEAHVAMGLSMISSGKAEAGLEFVETALRLSPSYPNHYAMAKALGYFAMNDMNKAAATLDEALARDPGAVELAPLLAASYAQLGRREDARAALLMWHPGANQSDLESIRRRYHVPYPFAQSERETENRFLNGLFIAALPLDVTIPSLIEKLRFETGVERIEAVQILTRFGESAAGAIPILTKIINDKTAEEYLKDSAERALNQIKDN